MDKSCVAGIFLKKEILSRISMRYERGGMQKMSRWQKMSHRFKPSRNGGVRCNS